MSLNKDDDLDPQFDIDSDPDLSKDPLVKPPAKPNSGTVTGTIAVNGINQRSDNNSAPVYADKIAVIVGRRAKIAEMQDIEETILDSGGISQDSVTMVNESFGFTAKTGKTKNEFTKLKSQTNYAYLTRWMNKELKLVKEEVTNLEDELSTELKSEREIFLTRIEETRERLSSFIAGNKNRIERFLNSIPFFLICTKENDTTEIKSINVLTVSMFDPVNFDNVIVLFSKSTSSAITFRAAFYRLAETLRTATNPFILPMFFHGENIPLDETGAASRNEASYEATTEQWTLEKVLCSIVRVYETDRLAFIRDSYSEVFDSSIGKKEKLEELVTARDLCSELTKLTNNTLDDLEILLPGLGTILELNS